MLRSPGSPAVAAAKASICARVAGIAAHFGLRQVGREIRRLLDRAAAGEPLGHGLDLRGTEAEAAHAAVDLEPGAEPVRAAPGFQHQHLFRLVHEGFERVLGGQRQFGRRLHALEQHDARADAGLAQRHGLFQPRDREGVGARERARRGHDAVAVGVRLDDGEHPAVRRETAHPRKIVGQGPGVDDRAQRRGQNAPSP